MVRGEEHDYFESIGHEVLSITTGRRSPGDKETWWWWNDKVQEVINLRLRKRQGRCEKHQEGRKVDISTGRQTRRSTTKARATNELYEELETTKGGRKMSRTAKAKDFTKNNQIKDEQGVGPLIGSREVGREILISC